ncbi:MAG: hypothetical protein POH28_00545 [Acidocella sp.]|nr:hypothetical protein [Acidocella sp.]
MAAYWNSRSAETDVNMQPMVGAISAPVGSVSPGVGVSPNLPPVETPAASFSPGVRTIADYAYAQAWAIAHGICKRGQPLDLKAANKLRHAHGEPMFVLLGDI